MKKPLYISKTGFMTGLKCRKLLWYYYNNKKAIPEEAPFLKNILEQGKEVGELARTLYPDGILVTGRSRQSTVDSRLSGTASRLTTDDCRQTTLTLKERKPVFEASFIYNNALAKADILVPAGNHKWDLIEVKSSGRVTFDQIKDAAFQAFVFEGAGIKLRRVFIMHLNKEYVKKGPVDPEQLFSKTDITKKVRALSKYAGTALEEMEGVIKGSEPQIVPGRACPKDCPLRLKCWDFLPDGHVFHLRGNKDASFELMNKGIFRIIDIPKDFELGRKQEIQRQGFLTGKAQKDKAQIKKFLAKLKYPLYFLDFETVARFIPPYDGTSPYETVPFQYSLHVVEESKVASRKSKESKIMHYSFLNPGEKDPRPVILKKLKELLGKKGSIVAYNANYEKMCIKTMAAAVPGYKTWAASLNKRFVDLLAPFKAMHYYHPSQGGTASLKAVLPAVTGISYDDLEIGEGGLAMMEYSRVVFGDKVKKKEKDKVFRQLEEYCGQDTLGMVKIVEKLRNLV